MNGRWRKKSIHHSNTEWMKLIYEIFTMIARCEIVGVSGITITAKQLMFCHRSEEIKGRKIQTYVLCVTTLTLNEFNVWPKQRIVTVFDYSPGESNPFPKRMFQIQAMNQQIGAKKEKSVVFQTRFEITLALDHWAGWDTYMYIPVCGASAPFPKRTFSFIFFLFRPWFFTNVCTETKNTI